MQGHLNLTYENRSSCPGLPPGGPDLGFYHNLGVAAAFFILFSSVGRLLLALKIVIGKRQEVNGFREWAWVALGTLVSIVDPWNGSLVSTQQMKEMSKNTQN
jgi:hypothetical protein